MKIALGQINTTVGAFKENTQKVCAYIDKAKGMGCDMVIFPEMVVTGYPPKDLLERPDFINDNLKALNIIKEHTMGIAAVVGFVDKNVYKNGKSLCNASAFIYNKHVVSKQYKVLLPNYDVFDEQRYFKPATTVPVIEHNGARFGITICEDIWNPDDKFNNSIYHSDPVRELVDHGAEFIINISASPYEMGKIKERFTLVTNLAIKHRIPFLYVNQVGGNDDLVFDGNSIAVNRNGKIVNKGAGFSEDLFLVEIRDKDCNAIEVDEVLMDADNDIADIYNALVLGVKDYVRKCGFKKVVIGLSGGIDSAVVAAIACHALGCGKVVGVAMPSVYSSDESLEDAQGLAENLGIEFKVISIKEIHSAFAKTLESEFSGLEPGITEENLQARMRGNIMMALSNKFGFLVLTTGNKSELSVGYCTLYGDMCGGLAVISDVPKIMVYDLARYINVNSVVIPINTIEKPPSAELKPDQKDQDSLPPYEILDGILKAYIEETESLQEIVNMGYDENTVREVVKMVDRNEYKRNQAAPGLRVTSKAFGTGRRIPIAQAYINP